MSSALLRRGLPCVFAGRSSGASLAEAACRTLDTQARWFAAAPTDEPAGSSTAAAAALTPEQVQHVSTFLSLLARPLATAVRGAALAGLAATYRDTALASESLYRRQVLHSSEPLLSSQPISRQQAADAAAADSEPCAYPLLDVASLPDSQFLNAGSSASGGQRLDLDEELMDKATAWMQVLPPHIEMSYVLMTGVHLFPPTEAVYTTYVDWDAALRHLDRHRSPHRLRELRRLVSKQDKFELESWNPAYVGRA